MPAVAVMTRLGYRQLPAVEARHLAVGETRSNLLVVSRSLTRSRMLAVFASLTRSGPLVVSNLVTRSGSLVVSHSLTRFHFLVASNALTTLRACARVSPRYIPALLRALPASAMRHIDRTGNA